MITRKEIEDLEKKLEYLKECYMKERLGCKNKGCKFFNPSRTNGCSKTVFHDYCEDLTTK